MYPTCQGNFFLWILIVALCLKRESLLGLWMLCCKQSVPRHGRHVKDDKCHKIITQCCFSTESPKHSPGANCFSWCCWQSKENMGHLHTLWLWYVCLPFGLSTHPPVKGLKNKSNEGRGNWDGLVWKRGGSRGPYCSLQIPERSRGAGQSLLPNNKQ